MVPLRHEPQHRPGEDPQEGQVEYPPAELRLAKAGDPVGWIYFDVSLENGKADRDVPEIIRGTNQSLELLSEVLLIMPEDYFFHHESARGSRLYVSKILSRKEGAGKKKKKKRKNHRSRGEDERVV